MAAPFLGVLGQGTSSATGASTIYTCPAGRRAVVSTCIAQNTSAAAAGFKIWHGIAGANPLAANLIADVEPVPALGRYGFTEGWCLSAGDKLYVASTVTGQAMNFTVYGEETDVPAS